MIFGELLSRLLLLHLTSIQTHSSLNIKISLNLHAKVRLDLDAQIYGDITIGLL